MKTSQQLRRKERVARKLRATGAKPRLSVAMTLQHIYAQVIDDARGETLAFASTFSPEIASGLPGKRNMEAAQAVGRLIAGKALKKGIKSVVFDRGPKRFHGRIRALADAARKEGMEF